MRVVVSYDISDDAARRRVAQALHSVVGRVQYSVFDGQTDETALRPALHLALADIDAATDSIRVYRLCSACARRVDVFGRHEPPTDIDVQVL